MATLEVGLLSETLSLGLAEYRIGPKIRALRRGKKLGLVQLGEHTGLSTAMLSKIERGQLFPTLPTLLRIAMVFGVGLDHFFVQEERPSVAVIRKTDRVRLPNKIDADPPSYFFESLDFPVVNRKMEVFFAEFPVGAVPSEPHLHEGPELIYLLRGHLAIDVAGQETLLGDGDAMCFDSSFPHRYRQTGRSTSAAIVVVAS